MRIVGLFLTLSLVPVLGAQSPVHPKPPIIVQPGPGDPLWDELNSGSGPSTNCQSICSLPCTYWFDTLLYKGYCNARIELCNQGSGGLPICQCDGKGAAPAYLYGQKHLMYQ